MAIKSFNGEPYWDDYLNDGASGGKSPRDKNYLRVLFQPGYSVQVRELNQIQSQLQNQIDQFGRSVYKEGTPVIDGLTTFDTNIYYVDIDINASGQADNLRLTETYISSLTNFGDGSGPTTDNLRAEILGIKKLSYEDSANYTGVPYRFFLRYMKSDTTGTSADQTYTAGDTIRNRGDAILDATDVSVFNANAELGSVIRVGYAASATVDKGVFLINGNFVVNDKTSLFIAKKEKTQEINGEVAWLVTETEVTASNDQDLLDNAAGQPNLKAPGAKRYQINLALKFLTNNVEVIGDISSDKLAAIHNDDVLVDTTTGQFVNLITITATKALIPARTEYTQLDRTLAERTFEESGNYTVKPFSLDVRDYLNDEEGNRGKYTTAEIRDLATAGDINIGTNNDANANTYGETRFIVGLEPSSAYVSGYKIDLNEKVDIPVEKSRTTSVLAGASVSASIGGYVVGTFQDAGDDNRLFDPRTAESATAANILDSSDATIGTCKLRNIEKISNGVYHLYVYDVIMNSGKSLANGRDIDSTNFKFRGENSILKLNNSANNNLLIPLPARSVKSISVSNVKARGVFTGVGGDTATIDSGSGNIFHSDATSDYVAQNEDTGAEVNLDQIPGTGGSGPAVGNQTIRLDFGASIDSGTNGAIIAPFQVNAGQFRIGTKTLTPADGTSLEVALANQGVSKDGYITITAYYDVIAITELKVSTDNGSTYTVVPPADYSLDNGQRDNYYDVARIRYNGTIVYPSTTDWKVSIKYFLHNETAANYDYFSVNSYDAAVYKDIPYYGNDKLSDVIDFRKKKGQGAVFPIDPSGIIELSTIEYYNPRVDLVVVNSIGDFNVIQGEPDTQPKVPETPQESMGLYELFVPAYTDDASDVSPKYIDNRRYTMRDIGALARRVKNVEYYTSLSLLEQETLDKDIFTTDGNVRFKNGILVDSFFGHNIGNPSDQNYSCSIDSKRGILRPQFAMANTALKTTTATELNSDIIQLDFTEASLINQPLASLAESVNPFDLADWRGFVSLNPTTDDWKIVDQQPDIIINDTSHYDQLAQMAQEENLLGTIWDEYEVSWRGSEVTDTKVHIARTDGNHDPTGARRALKDLYDLGNDWRPVNLTSRETLTTTEESRDGIRRTLEYQDLVSASGNKVINVSFIQHMRSRQITFEAKLMKPNTKVYAYFDGVDVSAFCTAISNMSAGGTFAEVTNSDARNTSVATYNQKKLSDLQATGSPLAGRHELITDDTGVLRGKFIIPNNTSVKFRVGERTFKLTDSVGNQDAESTTTAQTAYSAVGAIETKANTIITTRMGQIDEQRLTSTRSNTVATRENVGVSYYDPLAQSFIIGDYSKGIMASGIELYFQKKHATIPVRAHLVTVENGIPTQKVVPGTEVILDPTTPVTNSDGDIIPQDEDGFTAGTYLANIGLRGHLAAKSQSEINLAASTTDYKILNENKAQYATHFTYDQPVHLQPGVEYAIVVLSNSPEYMLYMAEVGGTDNMTNERIGKNPYAGVSFKSQNASTWTPNQNRDFKFKVKKAVYDPSTTKTVTLKTQHDGSVESVTISSGGTFTGAGATVTFSAPTNGGTTATGTVVMNAGNTAVTSVTINNKGSGYIDPPTLTFSAGGVSAQPGATAVLNTISNSYIRLLTEEVILPGTNITYTYKFSSDTAAAIIPHTNNTVGANNKVISSLASNSDTNKITVVATLSTTSTHITPMLDSQRLSVLSIFNLINDPNTSLMTTATTGADADDIPSTTNSADNDARIGDDHLYLTRTGLLSTKSNYITRSVVLNNPADRLTSYLLVNRPNKDTHVKLMIKLRTGNESYSGVEWYEVKPTSPIPVNSDGLTYNEVEFDFDTSALLIKDSDDPFGTLEFNAFAVRVVLISNDHRYVPTVKDFRSIATFGESD